MLLTCTEEVRFTEGTSSRTETRTVLTEVLHEPSEGLHLTDEPVVARGTLTPPRDAPPSFAAAHNQLKWQLHVEGQTAGLHYTSDFPVVVLPAPAVHTVRSTEAELSDLVRFNRNPPVYSPGDVLAAEYQLPDTGAEYEVSILWHTEGKGDEDLGVIHFESPPAGQPKGRFELVLPRTPLSYNGAILKVFWSVRLRRRAAKQPLVDAPFLLGNVTHQEMRAG